MTNEEAAKELMMAYEDLKDMYHMDCGREAAFNKAREALKAEPCEDAVSREFMYKLGAKCIAVRNENDELVALASIESLPPVTPKPTECENAVDRDAIIKEMETRHKNGDAITLGYIKNLPPVTPKLRTGKWIEKDEWKDTVNGFEEWGYFHECSKCGYVFKFLEIDNFCPNCGSYNGGDSNVDE